MPTKTCQSDRQTHLTFRDREIEREYNQILQKVRVLSSLSLFILFAALYAILTDIILLVAIIPLAVAIAILQYRYNNKLIELQNSDEARWV
jgi:putative flippase GtrA